VTAPFGPPALRGELRAGLALRASNEAGGTMTSGVGVVEREDNGMGNRRHEDSLSASGRPELNASPRISDQDIDKHA
jgi:hypothetical protein